MNHQLLFYLGDLLIGDINQFAKNRKLSETLKSEATSPTADTFSFTVNWTLFKRFINRFTSEPAQDFLKVGKTRIVFIENNFIRFAGYLASRPGRSGTGSEQQLELNFYEYFARLSGDLVCSDSNKTDPMRTFTNTPAHQYAKSLIDSFITHAGTAGETLNWDYGQVDTLGNKTITYKDFQTISKALCDAMNNVEGAGKFDIVFRTDPEDYTHQLIDILQPRGMRKNITIRFPADGIYKIWASDFSVQETNEYASEVLIAGNGQVGDVSEGEQTAPLGVAADTDFAEEFCYFRAYITKSNLVSQARVNQEAVNQLAMMSFGKETPQLSLTGRPINWGNATDENAGLALGDSFYFEEAVDDLGDNSGYYRIIKIDESWDDNGVSTVKPTLLPEDE